MNHVCRQAANENPYRLSPLRAYQDEVAGKPTPPEPTVVYKVRLKQWREESNRRIEAAHAERERERAASHAEDEEIPY